MTSNSKPRQIAWEILFRVEIEGQYSNIILPRELRGTNLEERDRGFVTELVYGSLRMRGFCDAAISKFSDRPISQIDPKLLITLRLGVYQILIMKLPIHAAVHETVELAKTVNGKGAATFVNAVLRRVSENIDFRPAQERDLYSHPQWIINAFQDALKNNDDVRAQLQADNEVAPPTLVAWPGRSNGAELVAAGAVKLAGGVNAYSFKGNPADIAAIKERRAGVQDLGSQIVVEKFYASGSNGMRWLDLCAGPGGKAAYLDSLISEGELVVNEPAPERMKLLSQVVNRGRVLSFDGRTPPADLGKFDRILIDAPCTGIGALRRRPEVRWRRTPQDLRGLIQLQRELLDSAVALLKPNGIIGYATCSPHLGETKLQVSDFLKRHPNFKRVSLGELGDKDGDLQLWTFRDGTDAMFLSLLKRCD